MDVDAAKAAFDVAEQAFHESVEISILTSGRFAALQVALLKGGIRSGDEIVQQIDRELALAALELWRCREALTLATDALHAAERPPMRPLLDMQLELVRHHNAKLYQRYRDELASIDEANDEEDRLKRQYICTHTRQEILRYQVPAEVAVS